MERWSGVGTIGRSGRGELSFVERLRAGPLLADGAMGTLLLDAPESGGRWLAPEEANLAAPHRVREAHAAYAAAGAQLVETNTIGGSESKLALAGLGGRAREVNFTGARLAREAVREDVWVAGSIGSTGRLLEPFGDLTPEAARGEFVRQAEALAAGGVDLIVVETMTSAEEAAIAVRAAGEATGLPVVASMAFGRGGRTVMGARVEDLAALEDAGAIAIGFNCGEGPDGLVDLLAHLRALAPEALLVAQPNAGVPRLEAGRTHFDASPADLADFALQAREVGVRLIGGCCGSTPEHIRAMAAALARPA